MTTAFALALILMAGAAVAFVLWPLLRGTPRGMPVMLAIALAVVLPAAALGLYALLGNPAALDAGPNGASGQPQIDLQQATGELEARLEKHPDDLDSWLLLARAREALKQPAKAGEAYARALRLDPDNPDILVASAQARSLGARDHRIDDTARQQLQHALAGDPENQRALWLLGISDYQRGRYADAADTWQHLLGVIDADSNPKIADAVRQQIQRARAAAAASPPAPAASTMTASQPAAGNAATGIKVHVALADALRARLAEDAAVYVFARAVDGPPMPLAVKRLRVADLPADVTLSDAMAMSPQLKLSMFEHVQVQARVSSSGQATPRPGDPEATPVEIDTRKLPADSVSLDIDHRRR